MKIFLLSLFAAVYYSGWWLMKHNQELWAFIVFIPCTFILFPLLWALFANGLAAGPAVAPTPVRSAEEMAYDNVLVPSADHDAHTSAQDAWQSFPDLPDDDEPASTSPTVPTPEQQSTAADPHKGQKELF